MPTVFTKQCPLFRFRNGKDGKNITSQETCLYTELTMLPRTGVVRHVLRFPQSIPVFCMVAHAVTLPCLLHCKVLAEVLLTDLFI
jgi:hypothetical protein